MRNYRFKFSYMIPNSWFYKLKYMSRTRNQKSMQKSTNKKNQPNTKSSPSSSSFSSQSSLSPSSATPVPPQPHHPYYRRKSYHFTRDLTTPHPPSPDNNSASQLSDPPRNSSKKRRSIKKRRPSNRASPRQLLTSSVSADCGCRASLEESVWTKPDLTPEEYPLDSCSSEDDDSIFPELGSENENGERPFDKMISWSNSCHSRVKSDILIDMSNNAKFKKLGGFDSISQFELPPVITKTDTREKNELAARIKTSTCSKEQRINSPSRKLSPGVKLRTNSPRLASKRFLQVHGRKSMSSGCGGARRSLSESFAVVKSSQDPHRDFKESMVEMITENNMRTSKDLEDLLACYLSLNSDNYHDLIIKVFKQIWFEITDIRLK